MSKSEHSSQRDGPNAMIINFPDRTNVSKEELHNQEVDYASLILNGIDHVDPSIPDNLLDSRITELLPLSLLRDFSYDEDRVRAITARVLEVAEIQLPSELAEELMDQFPKSDATKELLKYEISVLKWRERANEHVDEKVKEKGRGEAMMELFDKTAKHEDTIAMRSLQLVREKYGDRYSTEILQAERTIRAMFVVEPAKLINLGSKEPMDS